MSLVLTTANTSTEHVRTYGSTWPGTTTTALDWDQEYIGTSSSLFYIFGVRFTNVTIPKGATIDSAILSVQSFSTDSTQLHVNLYCSAEDNATTMDSGSRRPCDLTRTTNYGDWNVGTSSWTAGSRYDSSDLKTAVQEVTNRAGWASGNSLIVLITNFDASLTTARREIETGESAGKEPTLTINYTVGSTKTNKSRYRTVIRGFSVIY